MPCAALSGPFSYLLLLSILLFERAPFRPVCERMLEGRIRCGPMLKTCMLAARRRCLRAGEVLLT